ncbi:MAG: hypothetical protein ACLQFW_09350, partial [Xanthobacteraceae bacterium]
ASYPREEPGAGNLHARIREGESRMAELLDQFPWEVLVQLLIGNCLQARQFGLAGGGSEQKP